MRFSELTQDDSRYPAALSRYLGANAPPAIQFAGNWELVNNPLLAWMSSIKCPGPVITRTYDYAQKIRAQGRAVIGGFHSPMEWECLRIFVSSQQPVILCPARSLEKMRLPAELERAFLEERLLFLTPCAGKEHRASRELAEARNEFVAALADEIFIAYASPGGKMEKLIETILLWGKTVRRGHPLSGAEPSDKI